MNIIGFVYTYMYQIDVQSAAHRTVSTYKYIKPSQGWCEVIVLFGRQHFQTHLDEWKGFEFPLRTQVTIILHYFE